MMGSAVRGLAAALLVAACSTPPNPSQAAAAGLGGTSPLVPMFEKVGAETGVPPVLLATLSYVETRLTFVDAASHGATSIGLLGLSADELARGARLAGVTDAAAFNDPEASLRAGAALLRAAAPAAHTLEDFRASLSPTLAREVTNALSRGVDGHDAHGGSVVIRAQRAAATPGLGTVSQEATGYPGAVWQAASTSNYGTGSRGVGDIDHIVIHDTEGSFAGSVSWFQDPTAKVSAHYIVRSIDGYIVQMVDEKNVAWHDKCFNTTTIGIEHEGYMAAPERWYTEAMYLESAKLTAYLADKYGIAKAHGTILGHGEAPDCSDHEDPGPGWNWPHYIDLVKTGGAPTYATTDALLDAPTAMTSGDRATVTLTVTNDGNTAWDLDATRVGTAAPQDRASAFFVDGDWMSTSRATGVDAHVEPGETGTFTFDIIAPDVREPTMFDESFQLVEEGVTWFGPELHMVINVMPNADAGGDDGSGGCSAGGSGPGAASGVMLALGALVLPRRRRRAGRV